MKLGKCRIDQFHAVVFLPIDRANLIGFHQPRVANYIRI
jgi:hypothetical protein